MKTISIVVPAYNEQDALPIFYGRLTAVLSSLPDYGYELLFINDGSRDGTLSVIKELRERDSRVSYVNLSRNFGQEVAMLAGLDYARGDAVVFMDADCQDPPELLPELVYWWEGGYDDVYARRRTRKGDGPLKRLTASIFYRLLQRTTRIEIQRDTGNYRLLDRRCVEALKLFRESQRYTKGLFSWIGYNKKEVLFDREARAAGRSKWSFPKLLSLAIEGITSFTTSPLRMASVFGIIASLAAFVYMIVIFTQTLAYGNPVAGYPSLMVVVLFLGGIQLIGIGIAGEYIARIFNETKSRPKYLVDEHNGERETNIREREK